MTDVLREIVLPKLEAVRKSGSGFTARCPGPTHAHGDRNPSLSVSPGSTQPVVLTCHSGCAADDILAALGLTWADLSTPRERRDDGEWTPFGPAVAVYDYRDENGELLYQVLRTADKQFPVRVPDVTAKRGYRWKMGDTRRVLYRLPQVIDAVNQYRMVYIVEGEKDVATLEAHGEIATCNPGGAGGGWRPEYTEALREAVVMIIADKDDKGQVHARKIRDALLPVAASVTVAEAKTGQRPDGQPIKDITDHFQAGYGFDDLEITSDSATTKAPALAVDLWDFLDASDAPPDWVVPGLLERGDRLILTGFEGLGKSMLVRQLAICAAAGVHPFDPSWNTDYHAASVLFIDCENSESQSRRKLRPIATTIKQLGREIPRGGMRLLHRPEGVDLTREDDIAWLLERVTAHKPDVLFLGPFYRLHNANMNDEQVARSVVAVLDAARAINGCALITEAHAGHGEPGKNRAVRPTGSSLLLRWPEFGYGLVPNSTAEPDDKGRCRHVDVIAWRGPRDERDWPTHLQYGAHGDLPWKPWKPDTSGARS